MIHSTALWDRLTLVMCHRAKDKVVAVRLESIPVLSRLQDPRNAQDVVTEHLIRMLTCDPSKYVVLFSLRKMDDPDT